MELESEILSGTYIAKIQKRVGFAKGSWINAAKAIGGRVRGASESKPIPAMPHTARVKLDVHLFSQVDDTPAETHAGWAGKLVVLLRDKSAIQTALDSATFVLHDLLDRESVTSPNEARGRESMLSYEAVVSAV